MDETTIAPLSPAFKERRTGLIIFGILMIILGCFVALMVPLILLGQLIAQSAPGMEPMPLRFILPGVFMYGAMAVASSGWASDRPSAAAGRERCC